MASGWPERVIPPAGGHAHGRSVAILREVAVVVEVAGTVLWYLLLTLFLLAYGGAGSGVSWTTG